MTSKIVWSKQFNIKLNIISLINNNQIIYEFYNFKPSEYMLLDNKLKYNYDKFKNINSYDLHKYNLIINKYKSFEYGRTLFYNYL